MERLFGIDFGTTSSAVVAMDVDDDKIRFTKFDELGMPIHSIIAINKKTGELITGRKAWEQKQTLSEDYEIISSVKTFLDDPNYREVAGKKWYPIDIATELFKSLKKFVFKQTAEDMHEATVSIPVDFSAKKRDILRKAALNAGIEIMSFVSEPTAAFFSNYDFLKSCNNIAVFDWGGGTLDVSVLKNQDGKIYELAKSGRSIAGDYLDDKIARAVHSRISKKKGIEIAFDDMPLNCQDKLRVASEQAKRRLSTDSEAKIYAIKYGDYGIVNETLSYEELCNIIEPEIQMSIDCLKDAILESNVGLPNIDKIVLIGGSCRLKALQNRMKKEYGESLLYSPEEPDWDVGKGASLLSSEKGYNYSNQSVGIVLSDNSYYEFLAKDTQLNNWSKSFTLGVTNSSSEAQFVFDGSLDIRNLPDRYRTMEVSLYSFLQETLRVEASVDENLIFKVEACSSMKSKKYKQIWTYDQLKCYYKLPL